MLDNTSLQNMVCSGKIKHYLRIGTNAVIATECTPVKKITNVYSAQPAVLGMQI